MALYLIGDVQGCDAALARLLEEIAFSASRDRLVLLGDLVNRGPASDAVLRRVSALGAAATCLLGNHDLSLLAVAHGLRTPHRSDTLQPVLCAPDRDALLDWLRHQRLAWREGGLLAVHGGVLPAWDAAQVMALAAEVESQLRAPSVREFLAGMWGNEPARWDDALQGADRTRVIVNALTRLRFCTAEGIMHLKAAGAPDQAPPGTMPWFEVPGRRTADVTVAFGHWSQLGLLVRPNVLALDTGCVWGGCLTALRYDASGDHQVLQVRCEQAQAPGAAD